MTAAPDVQSRRPMGPGACVDDVPPAPADGADERPVTPAFARSWWILGLCVAAIIASTLQIYSGQTQRGYFLIVLCFMVCGVAAWIDVASRRIPNRLTYPALFIGLLVNALLPPVLEKLGFDTAIVWSGATGVKDGLLGFGLCAAIGIVSFMARGLGGGDVKLLAAVGAMLGFDAVLAVLFNTLLVAAVIGIINWVALGTLMARLQVVAGNLLMSAVTHRDLTRVYPFKRTESPFGLALLIGLALAQFIALHQFLFNVHW